VTANGLVIPIAPGTTFVTVSDSLGSASVQVPVSVSAFTPAPVAAYPTPGYAYNVAVDGSLAYVAEGLTGLQIRNVADGSTVGQLGSGGANAVDVRLRGGLAAVALGTGGVALVDVSNPPLPAERARVSVGAGGDARDVWLSGNTLYIAVYGVGL